MRYRRLLTERGARVWISSVSKRKCAPPCTSHPPVLVIPLYSKLKHIASSEATTGKGSENALGSAACQECQ